MAPRDDPGLQPERTILAWSRTVIAQFVLAALLLRLDAASGWRGLGLPEGLTAVAAVAGWLGGRRRARDATPPRVSQAPHWTLIVTAASTTLATAAAILLAFPFG